jgi:uncharacterized protein (DUF1697 family)
MKACVALLRGINVGGAHKVPMAELRPLCEALGWQEVGTYIQSGNVVFRAGAAAAKLEADLESAIERHFGFAVAVIVRTALQWRALAAANPFPDAARDAPNRVMIALSKHAPAADAAAELQARARDGERVVQAGGALWIDFPAGAGRSRLSPAVLDRLAGSPVTMRNWRTVGKVNALLAALDRPRE